MTHLSGFGSLAAIPEEKITDKITRRVLAGQKGMMVWWKIGAGTHVSAHSHPHEQLVWVVKGKMDFRIDKERRVLEAGGIAAIPGGVEHEGWCHEDTEVVDIFAPPREDFLAGGGPTWLREKKLRALPVKNGRFGMSDSCPRLGTAFQCFSLERDAAKLRVQFGPR